MTLVFTTVIPVPNIVGARVRRVDIDEDADTATCTVAFGAAGGILYDTKIITIRNGPCTTIVREPAPKGYNDRLTYGDPVDLPTGFTDFVTAYVGSTINARNRAAEAWLSDPVRHLLEAGTVS